MFLFSFYRSLFALFCFNNSIGFCAFETIDNSIRLATNSQVKEFRDKNKELILEKMRELGTNWNAIGALSVLSNPGKAGGIISLDIKGFENLSEETKATRLGQAILMGHGYDHGVVKATLIKKEQEGYLEAVGRLMKKMDRSFTYNANHVNTELLTSGVEIANHISVLNSLCNTHGKEVGMKINFDASTGTGVGTQLVEQGKASPEPSARVGSNQADHLGLTPAVQNGGRVDVAGAHAAHAQRGASNLEGQEQRSVGSETRELSMEGGDAGTTPRATYNDAMDRERSGARERRSGGPSVARGGANPTLRGVGTVPVTLLELQSAKHKVEELKRQLPEGRGRSGGQVSGQDLVQALMAVKEKVAGLTTVAMLDAPQIMGFGR